MVENRMFHGQKCPLVSVKSWAIFVRASSDKPKLVNVAQICWPFKYAYKYKFWISIKISSILQTLQKGTTKRLIDEAFRGIRFSGRWSRREMPIICRKGLEISTKNYRRCYYKWWSHGWDPCFRYAAPANEGDVVCHGLYQLWLQQNHVYDSRLYQMGPNYKRPIRQRLGCQWSDRSHFHIRRTRRPKY